MKAGKHNAMRRRVQKSAFAKIDSNVAREHPCFEKHHITDSQLALSNRTPDLGLVFSRTRYRKTKLFPVGQIDQTGTIYPAFR